MNKEITLKKAEKLVRENEEIGWFIDFENHLLKQTLNISRGEVRKIAKIKET